MRSIAIVSPDDLMVVIVSTDDVLPTVVLVTVEYGGVELPTFPIPIRELGYLIGGHFGDEEIHKETRE